MKISRVALLVLLVACTRSKRSGQVTDGGARLPAVRPPTEGRIDMPGDDASIIATVRAASGEPLVVWQTGSGLWLHAGGATRRLGDADAVASAWDGTHLHLVGPRTRLLLDASGAVVARGAGVDANPMAVMASGRQVVAVSQACDPEAPCGRFADVSQDGGVTWQKQVNLGTGTGRLDEVIPLTGAGKLQWLEVDDGAALRSLTAGGQVTQLTLLPLPGSFRNPDQLRIAELVRTKAACADTRRWLAWSSDRDLFVATLDDLLAGHRPVAVTTAAQAARVLSLACRGDDLVLAAQLSDSSMVVASSHDGGATWQHDGPWPLNGPVVAVVGAPPHARIYFSQHLPADFEPAEDAPAESRHLARGVIRVLEQQDGRFAGAATRTGLREQTLAYVGTDFALHDGHAWSVLAGNPDLVIRTEYDRSDFTDFAGTSPRAVTGLLWTAVPR